MKFIVTTGHRENIANVAKELEERGHEIDWHPARGKVPIYLKEGYYGLSADKTIYLADLGSYSMNRNIFQPHCLGLGRAGSFPLEGIVLAANENMVRTYKGVNSKVALVGWSKTDTLFNEIRRKEALSSVEHIKKNFPYDKTALVPMGPPWGVTFFKKQASCIFDKFSKMDMNLILKPHASWLLDRVAFDDWKRYCQLKRRVEQSDNMCWVSPFKPLYPLFLISDVCIVSRISCVLKEFSLVGPVIETDPLPSAVVGLENEKMVKGIDWIKGRKEDLESLITEALDKPKDERLDTKLDEWFWKRDGKVSERAANVIEEKGE